MSGLSTGPLQVSHFIGLFDKLSLCDGCQECFPHTTGVYIRLFGPPAKIHHPIGFIKNIVHNGLASGHLPFYEFSQIISVLLISALRMAEVCLIDPSQGESLSDLELSG